MDQRDPVSPPADVTFADDVTVERAWEPALVRDDDRWRAELDGDVRPLVERCQRLRDRGLLD